MERIQSDLLSESDMSGSDSCTDRLSVNATQNSVVLALTDDAASGACAGISCFERLVVPTSPQVIGTLVCRFQHRARHVEALHIPDIPREERPRAFMFEDPC